MEIVTRQDIKAVKVLVNEFIITNEVDSVENIPIEFLKYLRKANIKIEDSVLLNEIWDLIEKKLIKSDKR